MSVCVCVCVLPAPSHGLCCFVLLVRRKCLIGYRGCVLLCFISTDAAGHLGVFGVGLKSRKPSRTPFPLFYFLPFNFPLLILRFKGRHMRAQSEDGGHVWDQRAAEETDGSKVMVNSRIHQ